MLLSILSVVFYSILTLISICHFIFCATDYSFRPIKCDDKTYLSHYVASGVIAIISICCLVFLVIVLFK